jgi:hypothetical protein
MNRPPRIAEKHLQRSRTTEKTGFSAACSAVPQMARYGLGFSP